VVVQTRDCWAPPADQGRTVEDAGSVVVAEVPRARFLAVSAHRDLVAPCTPLLSIFHLTASPAPGLVRDCRLWLCVPGGAFHGLALLPASLWFYFPLGPEEASARPRGAFPPSGVPRYQEMGMRGVHLKNLGAVLGSKISTLNERTRPDEREKAIEVLKVGVELLQTVVVE